MFKLVIVEDEDNIRHSLTSFIPWNEIGFQVAGAFSDGSDALTYLIDNPCDAVLTDILMSRMSGLEMIAKLHEIYPQTKVVILSGHSNFEYAQQAIEYKVEHYLVKPVDEDELIAVFRSLSDQLSAEKEKASLYAPQLIGERSAAVQLTPDALRRAILADSKLLTVELNLGSRNTLIHILQGMIPSLSQTPLEETRSLLKDLYAEVEQSYSKRKIDVQAITGGGFSADHLDLADSPATIAEYLLKDFDALCKALQSRKQGSDHSVIGHLVEYLHAHLDGDISHEEIAARYRMHPGYLSRLFKQEMGETLSEYLLRIKMEKAAQLLKEGECKIGQIASMVGYNTSSYFSIMFKKHTGYSPREYSQKVLL